MNRSPEPVLCFLLADGTNGEARLRAGRKKTVYVCEREKEREGKGEAGLRNLHSRFLPRRFRRGITRAFIRRTLSLVHRLTCQLSRAIVEKF